MFAVPSVAIATPQGRKLIPNPAGNEAQLYPTLAEAEEAIRRAGFDYVYEGKKTYTISQGNSKERSISNGKPLETAVPLLIRTLQDREPSLIVNSAYALGMLKAPEALPALSEILGNEDSTVRKSVAEAMARFGHLALPYLRDAFEAARNSTHNNAPYIRLTVMTALVELSQSGANPVLAEQFLPMALEGLEDSNWLVRAQAALVVGNTAQIFEEEQALRERLKKGPGKAGL